jgi:hypothetical protein
LSTASAESGLRSDAALLPRATASAIRLALAVAADWLSRPWPAYLSLLALQLKVLWGDWRYRDLTYGDTASYFRLAARWYEDGQVHIAWSPLYTAYFGSLRKLAADVYAIVEFHRLLVVFAVAALVLALTRRLLPAPIAWATAAWWTLLHVNFNVMYEVHLFSLLPTLGSLVLLASPPNPWRRGVALGILVASTALVRNELIVTTGLLAIICLAWEVWRGRPDRADARTSNSWNRRYAAYGLPVAVAIGLVLLFYSRSFVTGQPLSEASERKHRLNMCQVIAFSYQQRHPEWTGSPWTECQPLMQKLFAKEEPSLGEAIQRNPEAVVEHFVWNSRLLPDGIQVSLFNATFGSISPDFVRVPTGNIWALAASITVATLLAIGGVLLVKEWPHLWPTIVRPSLLGWLGLFSSAAVVFLIIPIERPRPEYLYPLTFTLMTVTGLSAYLILRKLASLQALHLAYPILVVSSLIAAPLHWNGEHLPSRPLLEQYRQLSPYADLIANPNAVFLKGAYAFEIYSYLGRASGRTLGYTSLLNRPPGVSAREILDRDKVNLFYLDEFMLTQMESNVAEQAFLGDPGGHGWKVVALSDFPRRRWRLLQTLGALKRIIPRCRASLRNGNAERSVRAERVTFPSRCVSFHPVAEDVNTEPAVDQPTPQCRHRRNEAPVLAGKRRARRASVIAHLLGVRYHHRLECQPTTGPDKRSDSAQCT